MKTLKVLFSLLFLSALIASAAETNLTVGSSAFPSTALDKVFVIENTIAFSAAVAPAGGTINVLNIPADTVVSMVEYKVLTTNLISATFDIGYGTGATTNDWKAGANANTIGAVLGVATPLLYTAADTIDIQVNDVAISNGTVRVRALCIDMSK
jgi:hypothetical protein